MALSTTKRFFCLDFLLHHHISTVFPPPPPAPRFYCFPSPPPHFEYIYLAKPKSEAPVYAFQIYCRQWTLNY